jgi:hypothetical protein
MWRNWFRTQTVGGAPPVQVVERDPVIVADQRAVDAAYERGRLQERERLRLARRRGGSPLVFLLVALAVVFAVGMIYLAIRNGSFTSAGAAVDNGLAKAGNSVTAPIQNAKEKTGDALEKAGRDLK